MSKSSSSQIKGGGKKGAPKRWTGEGPRPARHIPWPELFKHHESVLTGHLKMMDMVRKHCVEGSSNWNMATSSVDRTHEMIRAFKRATRDFVPPKDSIERVPLGASSASMYPGYSPADHIYGEAAQEYGAHFSELKRNGLESQTDANESEDAKRWKRNSERSNQLRDETKPTTDSSVRSQTGSDQHGDGEPMEGVEPYTYQTQYFVIDSKPTPLKDLGETQKHRNKANDKAKRRVSFKDEQDPGTISLDHSDAPRSKKAKNATLEPPSTAASSNPTPPEENFSAEVEARLKAKEEKRRLREEKKRKRDSGASQINDQVNTTSAAVTESAETSSAEKPKKKKPKDRHNIDHAGEPTLEADQDREYERDKRKKRKKEKRGHGELKGPATSPNHDEKAKKKRKVETSSGK